MLVMNGCWSAQLSNAQFNGCPTWLSSGARLYRTGMVSFRVIFLYPPFVPELTFRSPFVFRVNTSILLAWVSAHCRYGLSVSTIHGFSLVYSQLRVIAFLYRVIIWFQTLTLHLVLCWQVWPVPVDSQGLQSLLSG